MIQITIKTDGNDIAEAVSMKDITLGEVALVLFRLKQIEHKLISKEFKSKYYAEDKGDKGDKGEDNDGK